MEREKWIADAKKRVRFMANMIWNGVNYTDAERFLHNFREVDFIGYALLDMLIYYSLDNP